MKVKKKAVVTVVSGDKFKEIWRRSEPFFIDYAEKCDADLIVMQGMEGNLPSPHWIKFGIYELLKKEFHRIAFIDADIIIRPDTPSLFEIVPEDKIGIFDEGQYLPRSVCIYEAKKVYNVDLKEWNGKSYYNTGVMVLSREHRHIFAINDELKPLRNAFGEQTYLNMRIMASGVKVFPLTHKFNRMSHMDRVTGMTRLDSYLIHYAGDGERLLTKMDRDIERWKKDAPDYKYRQQIFVWSLGGLGDVVCAEPTIRYMRSVIYPDADIHVLSKQHELYRHIDVERFDENTFPTKEIDAVFEMNTHPTAYDKFSDFGVAFSYYVPHGFVHPVDWVSINVLNRQLPLKDREIHLETTDEPCEEGLILVHPGKGWETKTFPLEWWQKVVDDLDALKFKVGIIGQHVTDEHGYVPIKCPPNGVDLRDKLSLQQLVNTIAKSQMVISNDSAPIHIAGAFDTNIILIPTTKHPDLLLPYRKGQQYYKAAAVGKKLIEGAVGGRATDCTGWMLSNFQNGKKIEDYIPDPEDVVNKVVEMLYV